MHENQAIKKPNNHDDAIGMNDRSNIGSEAGLKDCSLLVKKDGANQENSESDLKNNTVDEFLEEEPPNLAHH